MENCVLHSEGLMMIWYISGTRFLLLVGQTAKPRDGSEGKKPKTSIHLLRFGDEECVRNISHIPLSKQETDAESKGNIANPKIHFFRAFFWTKWHFFYYVHSAMLEMSFVTWKPFEEHENIGKHQQGFVKWLACCLPAFAGLVYSAPLSPEFADICFKWDKVKRKRRVCRFKWRFWRRLSDESLAGPPRTFWVITQISCRVEMRRGVMCCFISRHPFMAPQKTQRWPCCVLCGIAYLLGPTTAASITPGDAFKRCSAYTRSINDSFVKGEVKQLGRRSSRCEGSSPRAWKGGEEGEQLLLLLFTAPAWGLRPFKTSLSWLLQQSFLLTGAAPCYPL